MTAVLFNLLNIFWNWLMQFPKYVTAKSFIQLLSHPSISRYVSCTTGLQLADCRIFSEGPVNSYRFSTSLAATISTWFTFYPPLLVLWRIKGEFT